MRIKKKHVIDGIVGLIGLIGVILLGVMTARAGDVTKLIWFATSNFDSVQCELFVERAGGFVPKDTNSITSFPGTTLFVIRTDSHYNVRYKFYVDDAFTEGAMEDLGFPVGGEVLTLSGGDFIDTIFAVDTSGVDALVSGVKVTTVDLLGTVKGVDYTTGPGRVIFSLDSGAYVTTASRTGFVFSPFTDTVEASKRDTVYGYDVVVSSPGSASLCTVHGWLKDEKDEAIIEAEITAVRKQLGTVDSNSTAVIVPVLPYTVTSDSTGYFELFLRKTTTDWTDSTKGPYTITGDYNGKLFEIKDLRIPDQDSLNLGDSLAVRGK